MDRLGLSAANLRRGLKEHDEALLVGIVTNDLALVPHQETADIRALNIFLLGQLRLREAWLLSRAAPADPQRTSLVTFFAPLVAAIASGVFLVLDVGTEFAKVEGTAQYGATLGLAALASMFALIHALEVPRLRAALPRIAAAFALTWLLAAVESAIVVWILTGTSARSGGPFWADWLMWTSLSQFLGLFLSLVVTRTKLSEV